MRWNWDKILWTILAVAAGLFFGLWLFAKYLQSVLFPPVGG